MDHYRIYQCDKGSYAIQNPNGYVIGSLYSSAEEALEGLKRLYLGANETILELRIHVGKEFD